MTQKQIVLRDLWNGREVTPRSMVIRHDIFCLSERVRELRKDGIKVDTKIIRNKKTKKMWASYTLKK